MNLIKNCMQTPDGTILTSRSHHDYVEHTDANGKTYMVDGGLSYIRRSAHDDQIDLSVWDDAPFSDIRVAMEWGSYGVNGDQPLKWNKLCDMERSHIQAVLDNVPYMCQVYRKYFEVELDFRSKIDEWYK
tara:strand:+ start:118 stop:507 length:390 start_codon:yes stop_codon:yes gene_type:complete